MSAVRAGRTAFPTLFMLAIILPSLVSPFGIYLMRIYAEAAVPADLIEVGGATAAFTTVITGSLLSVIPLIIAFLFLQRYWQSGLGTGGVKG